MSERGRLMANDETRVRLKFKYLKENIDGKDFVDTFYQNGIMTLDEKLAISDLNSRTREERADEFLCRLLFSGPGDAYNCFIEVLRQKYGTVANEFEQTTIDNTGPYYSWFSENNLSTAIRNYPLTPSDACKLAHCFYDDWPIIFMKLRFTSCQIEQEYVRNQDRRPQIINLLKNVTIGKLVDVLKALEDEKSVIFNWELLQNFVLSLRI